MQSFILLFVHFASREEWVGKKENKTELFTNVYLCVFGANTAQSQRTSIVLQSSMGKRVRDWMLECFTVKSSDESCMICILHACCVGFSLLICTCVSFLKCNNFHSYDDTFCFHYYLTLLISKASFFCSRQSYSYLRTVRLDSLVASPHHLALHRLYTLLHEVCLCLISKT